MKKYISTLSVLLIAATIYWSFYDITPSENKSKKVIPTEFSIDNALSHLKEISKKPHYVGTTEHKTVQNYLVNELKKMGLEPEVQQQVAVNPKWLAATNTENIITKIKGTSNGKALLLLSHYDSGPHSSLGASDAGSGVVVILEGIRAYLAKNKAPTNDIIILISDAEELGLLGAKAFVDAHPWAKDVGLVLNFEARGSGGPSYMLMETNGKNGKLLTEFMNANPTYPAASSLMYSIYKMLPNDTDLTVFRENANINGFNFAFIGDHFDYHTEQDSYERLDRNTLLHQADYLTTTLDYFSHSDIENFESQEDLIYVNFPFIKLIVYPFGWILPMLLIALGGFVVLIFFGIALNKLTFKGMLKGFIPFLISLILCTGVSFGLWKLLLIIHPQYLDMLHGFTYNGYFYITAFVFLNLWMLFTVYKRFLKDERIVNLLIAPILIWLVINFLIYQNLQGAGFFIIPVFVALLILAFSVFFTIKKSYSPLVFSLLSIPTIYIFSPIIKMFPVGLGLKNLFITAVFIVLIFGLISPIFNHKKSVKTIQKTLGFLTILFFGVATFNSGFSEENKKPNSIVYIQDVEAQTAFYGTYNNTLDSYTNQLFGELDESATDVKNVSFNSKYRTRFKQYKKADFKNIPTSIITIANDTIIDNQRSIKLVLTPQRAINKLVFSIKDEITLNEFSVNGVYANKDKHSITKKGTVLMYTMGNADNDLTLSFSVDKETTLEFTINEISYDLLNHPKFNLTPRTNEMVPTPFVNNDAIICVQKVTL